MIDLSLVEHFGFPPIHSRNFLNSTFNIRSCIYPEVDMDINLRHERYCDNDCNRIYIDVKIQPYHAYLILLGISFDAEDIFSGGR